MELVDLQTAKKLSILGYDGKYTRCWVYSDKEPNGVEIPKDGMVLDGDTCLPKPRWDDVAYWLINKHNYYVNIKFVVKGGRRNVKTGFHYIVCKMVEDYQKDISSLVFDRYVDALKKGVRYALTLLKVQK